MQIEVLYPEQCNLFGDSGNIRYLKKCLPDAEFINTSLNDTPFFVTGDPDMIYMGACTESNQEKIITRLMPYKDKLKEAIDNGKVMLFTGNAPEVFYKYIEKDDKSKVECLGIFDLYAKQRIYERFNTLVLGSFDGKEVVGFKTQFTQVYGDNSENYFVKVERGAGINKESKLEGVHVNNFFATSMVGPLLVMNPYFTEYLMGKLGVTDPKCAFREQSVKAYKDRITDFRTCRCVTE